MGERDDSKLLISVLNSRVLLVFHIQSSYMKHYYRRTTANSLLRLLSFLSILFLIVLSIVFKAEFLSFLSVFGAGGRSCMFIICNGIVGILVKDCSCSSFSSSSSSDNNQISSSNSINYTAPDPSTTEQVRKIDETKEDVVEEIKRDDQEQQIIVLDDQYADDDGSDLLSLETEMGQSGCSANCDYHREEADEEDEQGSCDMDEEELELEDEIEEDEELSAKEFNRKCEDFIRMMWSEVKVVNYEDSHQFFCFS